jgi:hypothetical protein
MGLGKPQRGCPREVSQYCGGSQVSKVGRSEAWDKGRQIFMSAPSHLCCPSKFPVTINKLYFSVYMYTYQATPDSFFFSAG